MSIQELFNEPTLKVFTGLQLVFSVFLLTSPSFSLSPGPQGGCLLHTAWHRSMGGCIYGLGYGALQCAFKALARHLEADDLPGKPIWACFGSCEQFCFEEEQLIAER